MDDLDSKKRRCCNTKICCITFLVIIAVMFICLGGGSMPFLSKLYKKTVKEQLVLKRGNEAYNSWVSPPTTVYMQFYVFNYTNINDIITKNAKPKVVQLGPYSYRELRTNVVMEEDDYEITYLQNNSFVFDQETSCVNCTEYDIIQAPNIPVMTVFSKINDLGINENSSFFKRWGMEAFNKLLVADATCTMFMELPVYKLLWGFESPFLKHLDDLIPDWLKTLLPELNISPFIALQQNGTAGARANGNMTILTGLQNIDSVMQTTKWRGSNSTGFWRTKYGNMINGTDGSRFKPSLQKDDVIYIFVSQLCRSLYLNYEKDTSEFDIPLYRYTTTFKLFQNHTGNPDNAAFCDPKGVCYGTGLLPVGQCQAGNPPVFMSSPHFYQGYPGLWQAIDGLKPQKELHQTYLSVEPTTGIVMDAHKRLQININAMKVPFLTQTDVFASKENMLPVLYIHEFSTIDKPNAQKFKDEVMKPKLYITIGEYSMIGLGSLLFIIGLILGARYQRKKFRETKYETLTNTVDPTEDNIQVKT